MNRAIIIEDELYIRKGLASLINDMDEDITVVGECDSVKDAVVLINACKPDLVFLDINLKDGNAFDFLDQVDNNDFKVIFITAYEEYALKALKKDAVDYILKPVNADELCVAVRKALKLNGGLHDTVEVDSKKGWKEDNEKIILRLNDGYQVISLSDLMYCMSDKGYTTFFLQNGNSFLSSRPLKKFENKLPNNQFYRVHKSFFVNMDYVDKYDRKGYILLRGGAEVPVSSRRKEEFLSRFLQMEVGRAG